MDSKEERSDNSKKTTMKSALNGMLLQNCITKTLNVLQRELVRCSIMKTSISDKDLSFRKRYKKKDKSEKNNPSSAVKILFNGKKATYRACISDRNGKCS